ncbi:hypothetical protein CPD1_058 [Clostridium phage CPD1]|nr:hypothetical protein CPD1_058 [Clostridium phage CPD1]
MLKVGDKVKVREDLGNIENRQVGINEEMIEFQGKVVTIFSIADWNGVVYEIEEDEQDWYWTEEMFEKIEEKESNNMKELTFREVIANIKEGEVWESKMLEIYLDNKTSELVLKHKTNYFNCREIGIKKEKKFKLKRPQYTFQEAFKAFEEGKEIESCESGFKYEIYEDATKIKREGYKTIYEHKAVKIFSTEEIKGKWYIND